MSLFFLFQYFLIFFFCFCGFILISKQIEFRDRRKGQTIVWHEITFSLGLCFYYSSFFYLPLWFKFRDRRKGWSSDDEDRRHYGRLRRSAREDARDRQDPEKQSPLLRNQTGFPSGNSVSAWTEDSWNFQGPTPGKYLISSYDTLPMPFLTFVKWQVIQKTYSRRTLA